MPIVDDEPARPARTHQVGQDLSMLSVEELQHRIEALRQEIARIETELAAKGSTLQAAQALFKR